MTERESGHAALKGPASQGVTLFQRWLALELAVGRPLKEILADINTACDTRYKHNWPSMMEKRGYSMERTPRRVRVYMARKVLAQVLAENGVQGDEKLTDAIIQCLL